MNCYNHKNTWKYKCAGTEYHYTMVVNNAHNKNEQTNVETFQIGTGGLETKYIILLVLITTIKRVWPIILDTNDLILEMINKTDN